MRADDELRGLAVGRAERLAGDLERRDPGLGQREAVQPGLGRGERPGPLGRPQARRSSRLAGARSGRRRVDAGQRRRSAEVAVAPVGAEQPRAGAAARGQRRGGTSVGEATSPAEPCTEVTWTPADAARAVIPASGVTACPGASGTPADPPADEHRVVAGRADQRDRVDRPRTAEAPRSFLSSTMPASATCAATCWCAGVETSVEGVGSGLSNTPESKIAYRIRRSMSSRRDAGICPEVKSGCGQAAGAAPGSAGRSTPASAAATGSRTAKPKSGTTNPLRPSPCLRSPSVVGFWQLGRPLIWL